MDEYISRSAALKAVGESSWAGFRLNEIPAADVRPVPDGGIGEMSDGYHTFNGLYYQRMILFAALVNAYRDSAWKSWKHEDGKPCFDGGWFIVGIDTPQGSYTYHFEDKYWNWFECEELPTAKHWDGHTEADVTRLLSLPDVVEQHRWIPVTEPPKDGEDALVFYDNGHNAFMTCGIWNATAQEWVLDTEWADGFYVRAWMPLPAPPKED